MWSTGTGYCKYREICDVGFEFRTFSLLTTNCILWGFIKEAEYRSFKEQDVASNFETLGQQVLATSDDDDFNVKHFIHKVEMRLSSYNNFTWSVTYFTLTVSRHRGGVADSLSPQVSCCDFHVLIGIQKSLPDEKIHGGISIFTSA